MSIETEHFSIHFHQGLDEIAQKAAEIAEEIHYSLVREFGWEPLEKTQIVLLDDTDFTNGFATPLPYNKIVIQVVPPSIDTTIGEYEDWLKELIIHEYTHILTTDTVRGYSKVMRSIFGKPAITSLNPFSIPIFLAALPPNTLLPDWWLEGMATWGETEYTNVGRGRSTFYETILRMAAADSNIPSIDQINGDVPYWPDGIIPYIFGMRLQKYISDKYDKEAPGKLNLRHAGRAPYFIKGAPLKLFSKDYVSLYKEMIEELKREEEKRIEMLKGLPFTPLKSFDIEGEALTNPRYSPDGSLIAFNRVDPHRHATIMIVGRDGKGYKEVTRRLPSDNSICWDRDGSRIYFSQAEINRGFNVYQDIYSYDLKKDRLKRFTYGLRIKEPDISPDGMRFTAIVNDKGSQNLALLRFEGNSYRVEVLSDYKLFRLSNPRWSPDGRYIGYAVKDLNGRSGIHIYDVMQRKDSILFENNADNLYPAWSPDGKYIIYTSDETKVFNVFAYSIEEKRRYQITHLLGGGFQQDISSDGREMALSTYDSRGFKIATLEYSPEKWMTTLSPIIAPYWNEKDPSNLGVDRPPLVSILTGILSGIYPALRAVSMDPVEALRYE